MNATKYVDFATWERNKKLSIPNFDDSELAKSFIPYFENGQRIEVETHYEGKKCGYVGVTTGWRPAFILIFNKRAHGSSVVLCDTDKVLRTFDTYRS
jgi:hypothetical protein